MGLMVLATTLWGAASAGIAHLAADGGGPATVAAGGGAATLLALAAIRGSRPWRALRKDWSLFLRLGLLEVLNLALFVTALRLGPLSPVVALHLTSPVILLGFALVTRRRKITWTVLTELGLLATAITLISVRASTNGSGTAASVTACVLAVASAGCVAALISIVATRSSTMDAMTSAGLQLGAASCLGLPLLAWTPLPGSAIVELAAIGAGLLGPGFIFFWLALRRLDAPTAGVLGLNEAVAAPVIAAIVFGTAITAISVVATAVILAAVALEVRSTRPDRREILSGTTTADLDGTPVS
ncbi:hypothetical protein ACQP2U_42490 (plasmid) [Nocardia sp. CA-084685]|uniref:EamA family transporter n=1 Tax=Nocardia sp. CA-084685 TaxID=3239970 RepID=UPI003D9839DD